MIYEGINYQTPIERFQLVKNEKPNIPTAADIKALVSKAEEHKREADARREATPRREPSRKEKEGDDRTTLYNQLTGAGLNDLAGAVATKRPGAMAEARKALESKPERGMVEEMQKLKDKLVRFASGLNRPKELIAQATSGLESRGIGVDVTQLSQAGVEALAAAVLRRTKVFIDSGAFGTFRRALRTGKTVENDFDKVLERYQAIDEEIAKQNPEEVDFPRPLLVMPDVVGDQRASLDLIEKHQAWIKPELMRKGPPHIVIPLQKGELSLGQAYDRVALTLGSNEFIVGIPSNEKAVTVEEFREFVRTVQPKNIHILGASSNARLEPMLQVLADEGVEVNHLSADSSPIRNKIVEKGQTEVDRLYKIALHTTDLNELAEQARIPPEEAKYWFDVSHRGKEFAQEQEGLLKTRREERAERREEVISDDRARWTEKLRKAEAEHDVDAADVWRTKLRQLGPAPAETAAPDPEAQAAQDLKDAMGDLAHVLTKGGRATITPEQEQKILPILTRLMDAAFRLGYHSFRRAARYVLAQIRKALGDEVASQITIDHLQGAYIGMAGRYRGQGADSAATVAAVESLAGIEDSQEGIPEAKGVSTTPAVGVISYPQRTDDAATAQLQPGGAGEARPGTLEGKPAGEVPGAAPAGESRGGVDLGGRADVEGDGGPARGRGEPDRGVAAGPGAPPVAAGGDRTAGADTGQPGVQRAGGDEQSRGRAVEPAGNFVITDEIELGKGTPVQKYRDNVAAIKLLKDIEAAGRTATAAEQRVLARYVGWGGLKQAFPRPGAAPAKGWEGRVNEIRELLTADEHEAAARSIQDAHYTSRDVVDGMWGIAGHLGFDGGRVLETSMGVGNFFGLMPIGIASESAMTGVELDSITGRIAAQLYPQARVVNRGFHDVEFTDDHFNLVIGNPPFGEQSLYDTSAKHFQGWSIHNYFLGKSIDKLAAGGLQIQVVSRYFMDGTDATARNYIAQRARLVGAVRLPWTAFYENANTEVVTDIVIFQKLPQEQWGSADTAWTKTTAIPDPLGGEMMRVSRYFADHPEMILGQMDRSGEMRREGDITVQPKKDETVAEGVKRAAATLPANIYYRGKTPAKIAIEESQSVAPEEVTEQYTVGAYFVDAGKIYQRTLSDAGGVTSREITANTPWSEKTRWGDDRIKRLRGLIGIRTAARDLNAAEKSNQTDEEVGKLRKELNERYDAFVKAFGYLNERTNEQTFREDPDLPLMLALEYEFDRGVSRSKSRELGVPARPASAKKMPIFTQRVVHEHVVPTHADTPQSALDISISEKGRVSLPFMSQLTGTPEPELTEALAGGEKPAIYLDPALGHYVLASEYLSGNVKKKHKVAMDKGLRKQAEALKAVFPADLEAADVRVRMGAPWVDGDAYEDFSKALFGPNTEAVVRYVPATGGFIVQIIGGEEGLLSSKWGTPQRDGADLFNRILNNRDMTVYNPADDEGHRTVNIEATQAANDKASEIRAEFEEWIFRDAERRERLVKFYNENYNTNIDPVIDGSYLKLPGKVPDSVIQLRRHQLNAVARIIRYGKVLLDHVVGAGKTYTIIAAIMEMRRIGLLNKPMIVVPNHLVEQWATDFYRLYPGAKVLAMRKVDFAKQNRRRMLARVMTGDWDAVIFSHSSFGFIENDREVLQNAIRQQIRSMQEAIDAARAVEGKKSRSAAQYQKRKETLEQRMKALLDKPRDKLLTFQDIGVDQLNIDESQEFKNLYFTTQRRGVGGLGNPTGSKKAFDLYIKARWIQQKQNGKGVVFATGTPISNSLSELYTLQRYLGLEDLESRGIQSLDAWLGAFGVVQSEYESNVTGTKYKRKDRLRYITNLPEVMQLYKSFADSVSLADIQRNYSEDNDGAAFPVPLVKSRPKNRLNLVSPRSAAQAALSETLQERMEHLPADPRIDNALAVLSDGRKGALDMRLIDPSAGDFAESKVNNAANHIYRIYEANRRRSGTQLVFLDLSTPSKQSHTEANRYLRQARELLEDPEAAPLGSLTEQWQALRRMLQTAAETADEHTAGGEGKIERIEKFLEESQEAEAAATTADTGFSVYDDLRSKLIELGIPAEKIAFIHDFNSDTRKQELFDMVNAGVISILFGSTAKMGAGTNVQRKLVALHHLDVPWRPSDVEQREGRGIRQGNEFRMADPGFELEIIAYATEGTSDTFMWQIQEQKINGINSLRNYHGEREIAEVSNDSMTASEMRAISSGNPLILEDVQLTDAVRKLEAQKRRHTSSEQGMESRIRSYQRSLETLPNEIERLSELHAKTKAYEADRFAGHERPLADVDGKRMNADEAIAHMRQVKHEAEQEANRQNEATRAKMDELQHNARMLKGEERKAAQDEYSELVKTLHKPDWSITFNGKAYKSEDGLRTAITRDLGDYRPLVLVTDGKPLYRGADIEAHLDPIVRKMSAADGGREVVGTVGGMEVTLEWEPALKGKRSTRGNAGVSVDVGGESKFVEEYETYGSLERAETKIERVTGHRVVRTIEQIIHGVELSLDAAKRDLKGAQEGIGPLKEQAGKPWGKDEELQQKRERLAAVRKQLAGADTKKGESASMGRAPRAAMKKGTDNRGQPYFHNDEIGLALGKNMGNTMGLKGLYNRLWQFNVYDLARLRAGERVAIGSVMLELDAEHNIRGLYNIEINTDERTKGYGRTIVRSIVDTVPGGGTLQVHDILDTAREFWRKIGTRFHTDQYGKNNGRLSTKLFRGSRDLPEGIPEGGPAAGTGEAQSVSLGQEIPREFDEGSYRELTPARREELLAAVLRIADQIAPQARLKFQRRVFTHDREAVIRSGGEPGAGPTEIAGSFDWVEGVIRVALEFGNPKVTIRHEAIHYLRRMGLISDQEWALLEKQAQAEWVERTGVSGPEEAVAYTFEDYRRGRAQVQGRIRRIFNRIREFFSRLKNALNGMGFQTWEDVFERIESGEVGRRPVKPRKGGPQESLSLGEDVTRLSRRITARLSDFMVSQRVFNRWWHRTVGTQFHKARIFRPFRKVFNLVQDYLNDFSRFAIMAEERAPDLLLRMEGIRDIFKRGAEKSDLEAIAPAIFTGTLEDKKVYTDTELARKFSLTPKQIEYYRQFMESVNTSLDELTKSAMGRMVRAVGITRDAIMQIRNLPLHEFHRDLVGLLRERARELAELAKDERTDQPLIKARAATAFKQIKATVNLYNHIMRMKREGYAPLTRFGEYAVYVTRDTTGEPEELFFGMYESQAEANRAARAMAEEYPDATIRQRVLPQLAHQDFKGMSPDTIRIFAEALDLAQDEAFQEYIRLAVNQASALKRLLKRKGLPGYSEDVSRVLASFVISNARLTASNYHYGDMDEAVREIKAGDVKDEARNLVEYVREIKEEAGAFRGLLFFQFLGGSIASAMVNATQPVTMTAPYLVQFAPATTVMSEMRKAAQEAAKDEPETDVRIAYQKAKEEGIIAPHEIYQLMAESRMALAGSGAVRRFTKVWGSFFAIAEAFNRRTTFIAAWRIAVANGHANPYEFAKQAVYETQGLYNKGNRPNWARGAPGAVIFTFKQFSISYIEFLKRLPAKERAIALLILFLAAGLEGLPFAEDAADIIDTIAQWMGYAWNTKREIRKGTAAGFEAMARYMGIEEDVAAALGRGMSDFVARGVSALPGFPLDISARMGMHNLIPGTSFFKVSSTDKAREIFEVLGPAGSLVRSAGEAITALASGQYRKAAESVLPVAIQNAIRGTEMWATGQYKDREGKKIMDASKAEGAIKATGFNPRRMADEGRRAGDLAQDRRLHEQKERAIVAKIARGRVDGDKAMVTAGVADLIDWNTKNPEMKIVITQRQIRDKARQLQMDRKGRMTRQAPKELRGHIQEGLRE